LHKDYTETIEALRGALKTMKGTVEKVEKAEKADAASLAQIAALQEMPLIPDETKEAIASWLQLVDSDSDSDSDLDSDLKPPTAKKPKVTHFQSDGVINMLDKMVDRFVYKRNEAEKREMQQNHDYKLLAKDLDAQTSMANKDIGEKTAAKAKALKNKASSEGDLQDTRSAKAADEKYVADLEATCDQKAADFKSRQQLRAEELEAINKAIKIISSGSVKGSADKHLPSFSQLRYQDSASSSATALLFLRSQAALSDRMQVAELLQSRADRSDSRVLAALAERIALGSDPFKKVKKMIQDLIVRLLEQAAEEAEKKGWCDTELTTNKQTRATKSKAVDTLKAEIDGLKASTTKLTEEIAELTAGVAELDKAMETATKLRGDEKDKNEQTIQDAQEAQAAVEQALLVLREFYDKAGSATAFSQLGSGSEAPEIFDKPYQGMGKGGVVGMLEVIESDFAQLQSDTSAAEATAAKEYDSFISDSKVDKTAKGKDIEHKSAKKQEQSRSIVTKKEDLEGTEKELAAALRYFDKLKPSCLEAGESYEEKVARRKDEIQSLKEALEILNGDNIP